MENKKITYNDYLEEIRKVKDPEEIREVLKKIPGGEKVDVEASKSEIEKVEKIILSMNEEEREGDIEISNERREELAQKAGVDVEDVHKLIRGFARVKLLMKGMQRFKKE
jgi:signal recognition particle subunit SRP54